MNSCLASLTRRAFLFNKSIAAAIAICFLATLVSAHAQVVLPFQNAGTVTITHERWFDPNEEFPLGYSVFTATDFGTGTPMGPYTTEFLVLKYPTLVGNELVVVFKGVSISTAASGEQIFFSFVVEAPMAGDQAEAQFTGRFRIEGGTGRFRNASGRGTNRGTAFSDGTFQYESVGTISLGGRARR